jgi:phosphopantothenoylcysteine decarboxylase/phosphopantothenate--cysteine ligase
VRRLDVVSAEQMLAAAAAEFPRCDLCFAAAAVADQRPVRRAAGKPVKPDGRSTLELEPTPDVVATLAAAKGPRTVVGFALEASSAPDAAAIERARRKLADKRLDLIVLNRTDALGSERSSVTLLFADGTLERWPAAAKTELATRLVARAIDLHFRKATTP